MILLRELSIIARAIARFRRYEPQPLTLPRLWRWLRQFHVSDWTVSLRLLDAVKFIDKATAIRELCALNERLLASLAEDGVPTDRVIYVQFDSAGSSSAAMLNLLRDHANLERRGARFLDSRDVGRLTEMTLALQDGAIVYVDDFVGTGKQFRRNRRRVAEFAAGAFSEFLLTVCACEEAWGRIDPEGVNIYTVLRHLKAERPIRTESSLISSRERGQLLRICGRFHPTEGKGFDGLATSVVLYRNAPNTTPLMLRGNLGQHPLCGVLPRWDDRPLNAGPPENIL